ncbi:MAG: hypothetical protein RLZZ399_1285 [Verrucomicrobiota bacterium]|jgi:hypothetical protein
MGYGLSFFSDRWLGENPQAMRAEAALASEKRGVDMGLSESVTENRSEAPVGKAVRGVGELWHEITQRAKSPAEARLRLMEAIQAMDAVELSALLESEVGAFEYFRAKRFEFQYAVARLSEIAPVRAAELWARSPALRAYADVFLAGWVARDPGAFAAWILAQPGETQTAASGVVAAMAKQSPEQFLSVASQMANSAMAVSGARSAIRGFLSKDPNAGDLPALMQYAGTLPEGPLRAAALCEIAKAPGVDLSQQPEVARALVALKPEEAREVGDQLWKSAASIPPSPVRDAAFVRAFQEHAKEDVAAAAKQLESMRNSSPDYPAAVRGFVTAAAPKDPSGAIEWALSIDPSATLQRASALEKAAAAFFKQKPEEARAWVETAPLSPAEYFQLTGRTRSP